MKYYADSLGLGIELGVFCVVSFLSVVHVIVSYEIAQLPIYSVYIPEQVRVEFRGKSYGYSPDGYRKILFVKGGSLEPWFFIKFKWVSMQEYLAHKRNGVAVHPMLYRLIGFRDARNKDARLINMVCSRYHMGYYLGNVNLGTYRSKSSGRLILRFKKTYFVRSKSDPDIFRLLGGRGILILNELPGDFIRFTFFEHSDKDIGELRIYRYICRKKNTI